MVNYMSGVLRSRRCRQRELLACAGLSGVLVAACSGVDSTTGSLGEPRRAEAGTAASVLPSAHVHGVDIDPADGSVYLATNDGLFRYSAADLERAPAATGPAIDLMGFAVVGPRTFYASGHPGDGSRMPDPVGLLKSTDAGRTWNARSRAGTSDFHALTATDETVLGYDGSWQTSSDGRMWRQLDLLFEPYSLAASTDGKTVVATTEKALLRSTDGGGSWTSVNEAPVLMVVNWAAGTTVVGLTPAGELHVSTDAGSTWQRRGVVGAPVQAVGADGEGADLWVVAVTETTLVQARGPNELRFSATGTVAP